MKRLAAGVYADDLGGLHLDMSEMLKANGYEDNAVNRRMLEDAARDLLGAEGVPVEVVE